MPRVIGIDPGTVSIDLCGLDDGRVFLDRSVPTADALADPAGFVALLEHAGPLDLIAGPSGYGLPLRRAAEASEEDLRLAFLAAPGEPGGIGGLRALVRALARSDAVADQARRFARPLAQVSLVLLELGGAFTAAIAVARGQIVDGVGGSAGPLGFRAPGALDGEVAYLAGEVPKALLFRGGATAVAGWDTGIAQSGERQGTGTAERFAHPTTPAERIAWKALVESTVKTAVALATSVPAPAEFVLSGRLAQLAPLAQALAQRLGLFGPTRRVEAFATVAKEGAQGAALLADGLAGGANRELVERLAIRDARGSVLDHLYVIGRDQARRRLGLA